MALLIPIPGSAVAATADALDEIAAPTLHYTNEPRSENQPSIHRDPALPRLNGPDTSFIKANVTPFSQPELHRISLPPPSRPSPQLNEFAIDSFNLSALMGALDRPSPTQSGLLDSLSLIANETLSALSSRDSDNRADLSIPTQILAISPSYTLTTRTETCVRETTAVVGIPTKIDTDCSSATGELNIDGQGNLGPDVQFVLGLKPNQRGPLSPPVTTLSVEKLSSIGGDGTFGVSISVELHSPDPSLPDPLHFVLDTHHENEVFSLASFINLTYEHTIGIESDVAQFQATTSGSEGISISTETRSATTTDPSLLSFTLSPLPMDLTAEYTRSTNTQSVAWEASEPTTLRATGSNANYHFQLNIADVPPMFNLRLDTISDLCGPTPTRHLTYDSSDTIAAASGTWTSPGASFSARATQLARHLNLSVAPSTGEYSLDSSEQIGALAFESIRAGSMNPSCSRDADYSHIALNLIGLPTEMTLTTPPGAEALWLNASSPIGQFSAYTTSEKNASRLATKVDLLSTQNLVSINDGGSQFFGANIQSLNNLAILQDPNGVFNVRLLLAASLPFSITALDETTSLSASITNLPPAFDLSIGPNAKFSYSASSTIDTFSATGNKGAQAFHVNAANLPAQLSVEMFESENSIHATLAGSSGIGHLELAISDANGLDGTPYTTAAAYLDDLPPTVTFAISTGESRGIVVDTGSQPLGSLLLAITDGTPLSVPAGDYFVSRSTLTGGALALKVSNLMLLDITSTSDGVIEAHLSKASRAPFFVNTSTASGHTQVWVEDLPESIDITIGPELKFTYHGSGPIDKMTVNGNHESTWYALEANYLPPDLTVHAIVTPDAISGTLSGSAGIGRLAIAVNDTAGIGGTTYTSAAARLENIPSVFAFTATGGSTPRASVDARPESIGILQVELTSGTAMGTPDGEFIVFQDTAETQGLSVQLANLRHAEFTSMSDGSIHGSIERTSPSAFYVSSSSTSNFLQLYTTQLPATFAVHLTPSAIDYAGSSAIQDLSGQVQFNNNTLTLTAEGLPAIAKLSFEANANGLISSYRASATLDQIDVTMSNSVGLFSTPYTIARLRATSIPPVLDVVTSASLEGGTAVSLDAGNASIGFISVEMTNGLALQHDGGDYALLSNTSTIKAISMRLANFRHVSANILPDGSINATLERDTPTSFYFQSTSANGWLDLHVPMLPASIAIQARPIGHFGYEASSPLDAFTSEGNLSGIEYTFSATGLPSKLSLNLSQSEEEIKLTLDNSGMIASISATATNTTGPLFSNYKTLNLELLEIPSKLDVNAKLSPASSSLNLEGFGSAVGSVQFTLTDGPFLEYEGPHVVLYNNTDMHVISARIEGLSRLATLTSPSETYVRTSMASPSPFSFYYRGTRTDDPSKPGYVVVHAAELPTSLGVSLKPRTYCDDPTESTSRGCIQYSLAQPVASLVLYSNMRSGKLTYAVLRDVPDEGFLQWNIGGASYSMITNSASAPLQVAALSLVTDLTASRYTFGESLTIQNVTIEYRELETLGLNDRRIDFDTAGTVFSGYLYLAAGSSTFYLDTPYAAARGWHIYVDVNCAWFCFGCDVDLSSYGDIAYSAGTFFLNTPCWGTDNYDPSSMFAQYQSNNSIKTNYLVTRIKGTGIPWSAVTAILEDASGQTHPPTLLLKPFSGTVSTNDVFTIYDSEPGIYNAHLLYRGQRIWTGAFYLSANGDAQQHDGGTFGDAPSTAASSRPLDSGEITGTLGAGDTTDMYSAYVPAGQVLRAALVGPKTMGLRLDIYSPTLSLISTRSATGHTMFVNYQPSSAGTYFVKISSPPAGYGNYDLYLSGPSKPAEDYTLIKYLYESTPHVSTDSPRFNFTLPPNTVGIWVNMSDPPGSDYDLSLWDERGRRTGGYTSSEYQTRTLIPNSIYSGYSAHPERISIVPPSAYSQGAPGAGPDCGGTNEPVNGPGCGSVWQIAVYNYAGAGKFTATIEILTYA